jgi:hypothetical protein
MGIFFSCSAKLVFRSREESLEPIADVTETHVNTTEDIVEVPKKLLCKSMTCSCHHKVKSQTSLEEGVIFREKHVVGVEIRRSLVTERVSHFEDMIRQTKSCDLSSLNNLQIVDEKSDGDELQLQVEISCKEDVNIDDKEAQIVTQEDDLSDDVP